MKAAEAPPGWREYLGFRAAFAAAMDPRLFRLDQLDEMIWSGRARFWSSSEAAIAARLKTYPSGVVVLEGLIAAGELDHIKKLIPEAEAWGRGCGARLAMIESRSGWARELKSAGYEPHQIRLMKEL